MKFIPLGTVAYRSRPECRADRSEFRELRLQHELSQAETADHGLTNLSYEATLAADPDGDGFTTLQEYIADTDPTNAASFLILRNLQADATMATLGWTSVPRRFYTLYRATNLPDAMWSNIGSTANGFFHDANRAHFSIYRLGVEVSP